MDDDISYDGADTTGIFEEFFNEGLSNVIKKHSRHPMESVMDAIERDSDDAHKPIIRLYEGRTEYTENELRLLQTRDFKTRLFISNQITSTAFGSAITILTMLSIGRTLLISEIILRLPAKLVIIVLQNRH